MIRLLLCSAVACMLCGCLISNTDRAAAKLAQKGHSVKETAAELEFGNAFYFSRFFRRQTGISPREFQQLLQQKTPLSAR